MQNPNTTNVTSSTSAIKEPRNTAAARVPKLKLDAGMVAHETPSQNSGIIKRILQFLSSVFRGSKKEKIQPAIITPEPQIILFQEKQTERPAAIPQESYPVPPESEKKQGEENILRRLAEQQFLNMDVTRETRN